MIGDFGLAVALDRSRLTQAGMMVGTVSYMPPEQAMGGEVTARSDLYSLGAMLYEMVCGRPPFVGDESVAIIGQHLNTPPVAPSWHRPDCPPGLEALILRLLEKDPSRRPASARDVGEALTLALSQDGRGDQKDSAPVPDQGEGGRRQGEGSDPLYRRTFVGREQELRQLRNAFDAALSGRGALAMVVGEPGIGKTSVCEQLATYASLRGARTLVGHCYEEGSLSLPYLPFVEAMRSYVLARDVDGLRSDLGSGASEVARIVSEVRDKVQISPSDGGDPEEQRWRLLQAVTGFLRNASTVQPILLVLEDLHDADRGTLDLLLHVSRNLEGSRLLIIGTYRDVEVDRSHPLSAAVAELRRANNFLRVPLRGLTVDEVHRMYEALRGNDVPIGAAELVHRQTEGNPLFVQEVLRFLVEEGVVVREGSRYVAQGALADAVPEGLRDVVGRRLSHLSDQTNQVLSIAAVIGREFRLDVLEKVAGLPEQELYDALQEASARAVLEQRQLADTVGFRFSHAFFRQTLYEEVFIPRRIRLHQQVGRALEETYGRRIDEHAAELAEHFVQSTEAADLEKALHYCEQAGQRAMSVFAYGEAVRHLEQALRAQEVLNPDDKSTRCDLLIALSEVLTFNGEGSRALDTVAPEALILAEAGGNLDAAARICRLVIDAIHATMANRGWDTPRVIGWAEAADRHALPGTATRVWADGALGRVKVIQGQTAEGEKLLKRAIDLARQLGDNETFWFASMMWMETMLTQISAPRRQESLALAEELQRRSREGVSALVQRTTLFFMFVSFLTGGRRAEMDAVTVEMQLLADRTRQPNLELQAKGRQVYTALIDGRLEEAIRLGESLVARAEELGLTAYLSAFATGPLLRVDRLLGQAHDFPPPAPPPPNQFNLRNAAIGLEEAVNSRSRDQVGPILEALSKFDLGPILGNLVICRPRLLGDAYVVMGDPIAARRHYDEAMNYCQQVRFRPEIALIRLGLAELLLAHYPDERDEAIEHLDFAISEFREMKMQPSLERALRHRGLLKA